MNHKKVEDTYIFGRDALYVFKFIYPFIGLILWGISLVFLPQAIQSPDNRGAGIVGTAIFITIGMCIILFSKRFSNMAATQYFLHENAASNRCKTNVTVSMQAPVYTCILPLLFQTRARVISMPIYLVSNVPIPYIPRYKTGALGLAKQIIDLGIVVLPVNEKTTTWIHQATNITPPEYPKIAYVQK